EALREPGDELIGLLLGQDERRGQLDVVAGHTVDGPAARVDDDAACERFLQHQLAHVLLGRERPLGLLVHHQLEPDHQPQAAHVADSGCARSGVSLSSRYRPTCAERSISRSSVRMCKTSTPTAQLRVCAAYVCPPTMFWPALRMGAIMRSDATTAPRGT